MPRATKCAHSAAIEAPQASSTRRRFVLPMTAPRAEIAWPGRFISGHCAHARTPKSTAARIGLTSFTTGWEEPMAVKPIPEGYHSLNAYLAVDDAAAAIEYYSEVFAAKERFRMDGPDG